MELEKEAQIQKIHEMLESHDSKFFELGFQLMESLGLTHETLKRYGNVHYENSDNQIRIAIAEWKREIFKILSQKIERLVDSKYENSKITRIVFTILVELYQETQKQFFLELENGEPNITFLIELQDRQVVIKRTIIFTNNIVEEITKEIENLNQLDKEGTKQYILTKIKSSKIGLSLKGGISLGWVDIRRKGYPNLIQYEVQPFDKNYSIFKVHVTINVDA